MNHINLTYSQMREFFCAVESENMNKAFRKHVHVDGYILFSQDSFDKTYSVESRTYVISSNNKAFQPNMGGYSIYGSSVDGSDPIVRLERYMADEKGGEKGWKIESCYIDADDLAPEATAILSRLTLKWRGLI